MISVFVFLLMWLATVGVLVRLLPISVAE